MWFVSLAQVTDEAFVEPAIAARSGRAASCATLRSKRLLLLVLDNLEQLRGAAPIVAELLGSCPDVRC